MHNPAWERKFGGGFQNGLATHVATAGGGSRCSGLTYEFGVQRPCSDFPVFDHHFQMHGTVSAEPVAFNLVGRGQTRGLHHRRSLQTEDSAFAHVAKWSAASGVETLGKHNRLLSSPGVGAYRRHPRGKGSSFTHTDRNKHAASARPRPTHQWPGALAVCCCARSVSIFWIVWRSHCFTVSSSSIWLHCRSIVSTVSPCVFSGIW